MRPSVTKELDGETRRNTKWLQAACPCTHYISVRDCFMHVCVLLSLFEVGGFFCLCTHFKFPYGNFPSLKLFFISHCRCTCWLSLSYLFDIENHFKAISSVVILHLFMFYIICGVIWSLWVFLHLSVSLKSSESHFIHSTYLFVLGLLVGTVIFFLWTFFIFKIALHLAEEMALWSCSAYLCLSL